MANYYMEFCVAIERVSKEEAAWFAAKLKEMKEQAGLTFGYKLEGTSLCLHGDVRLDDQVLEFLRAFFRAMRPQEYILIEYSCTADGPYDDAFGGGMVFVSAHTISWSDIKAWRRSCLDGLAAQVDGPIKAATEM